MMSINENYIKFHLLVYKLLIVLLLFTGMPGCNQQSKSPESKIDTPQDIEIDRYTSLVNPFIGTDGKGKTYPGATMPFGMVQLSPDNGRSGWDWISGYYYPDTVIAGFSHTHLSGTGIGDLYDISYFPFTGRAKTDTLGGGKIQVPYSRFSHTYEKAEPGYYAVLLTDYNITVELTATERAGFQKYTYTGDSLSVNLNLGYARNWDSTVKTKMTVISDTLVTGYRFSTGWAKDQRIFFASAFSQSIAGKKMTADGVPVEGTLGRGRNVMGTFYFTGPDSVLIKTGISSVSEENALLNLKEELPHWDFRKAKMSASDVWEEQLQKIKVTTTDDESLEKFYTAMYQSMLAPTIYSDINGEYKGADGKVRIAEDYTRYTTFSLWDTFRAQHPLLTVLHPERIPDMINSMLAHYDEYGKLPVWDLHANETDMMIGYHAVPVIADAYLKGIRGFDAQKALEAMIKSAEQQDFGLRYLNELGFIPQDKYRESVSLALEYAYDDYCISRMAEALGKTDIASEFTERSQYYRKYFDESTGFMRALNSDREFTTPFDPKAYNDEYIEGNAWQYSWFVPHDVEKLIELHGGREVFIDRLDQLFKTDDNRDELPVFISGLVGQYVHGNEPGHHIPYLYALAGAPEKTQAIVRKITDELHKATPDGICGNEDCGQMSAWYIFSAMGFYPVNPCGGEYVLGTPHFKQVEINTGFKIIAENNPERNYLVDKAELNGQLIDNHTIHHRDISKEGELRFTMKNDQEQQ